MKMRVQPRSKSRRIPLAMAVAAGSSALLAAALPTTAATLTWDADGTVNATFGGSQTWNTGSRWYDGSSDTVWTNGNIASFGGTAGDVTITSGTIITTSGMEFTTSGYNIKGANSAARLQVDAGSITIGSGLSVTLSVAFATGAAGNNIAKDGQGTLVLASTLGGSAGSGNFNINNGTVNLTATGGATNIAVTTLTIGDGTHAVGSVILDGSGGTSTDAVAAATVNINTDGVWIRSNSTDTIGNIGRLSGQTIGGGLLSFSSTATTTISGTNAITSGIFLNSGGNRDHHFVFLNASDSLDLGGVVTNTGTGSFTNIVGPVGSTMTFSGSASNVFARNTTVTGATLLLAKTGTAEALTGTNSGVATVNGGGTIKLIGRGEQIGETGGYSLALGGTGGTTVTGGTLDLNGFTETLDRGISAMSGNGVVKSTGGGGKLIWNTTLGSGTLAPSALTATGTGNEITIGELQLTTLASRNGGPTEATRRIIVSGASDTLLISSTISNYAGINSENGAAFGFNVLEKTGNGTLTLTGTNTYVGLTNISGGILSINQDRALGATPNVAITNISLSGGTLASTATLSLHANRNISMTAGNFDVAGGTTLSYGGVMTESTSNGANLKKTGLGELAIIGSNNVYGGVTNIAGGTLSVTSLTNGDGVAINTSTGLGSNLATVASTAGLTVGMYAGASGKIPAGITIAGIDNVNKVLTLSSGTGVTAGTLTATAFGSSSSLGYGPFADAGRLVLDSGRLRYAGSTAGTSNRAYTLTANGGGYDASGTNTAATMSITGNMTASATVGSQAFTLTGSNTGNNTIGGSIVNGGGTNTTSLVKSGAGKWILTGANTYSGGTTVSGGTLLANNATNSTGAGAVIVQSGGTLGGLGKVNGAVTAQSNGTVLAGDGSTGTTLTLASDLTMGANSVITLALGDAGAHSTLARTGGTWTFDANQSFTALDLSSLEANDTFDNVITGLAADPGTTASWHFTNAITGVFTYDGSGGVDLTITAVPEPATLSLLSLGAISLLRRRRRTVETVA